MCVLSGARLEGLGRDLPPSPRAFRDKSEVHTRLCSSLRKADTRGRFRVSSLSRIQMCTTEALW